jgi:hypothetical protein
MDRRYPQHPTFDAEPKKQDLDALLDWMVQAGETNVSVAYDYSVGRVLNTLGKPLELVNLGQTKASLRLDSRYIKDVLQRTDQDSVAWAPVADHLRETYGFQPAVIDLFLCFLCQRDHRALQEISGDAIEVRIGMPQATRVRLQRGRLMSAADWHRLRDLGNQLFDVPRPPPHRSLQGQDRFAFALRERGQVKRTVLQGLHDRLVHLGLEHADRLKELSSANNRLGALAQTTTDSHKVLTELLAAWPDDNSDPIRSIVQQAETIRDAVGEINEHALANLKAGVQHAVVGTEVRGHLEALDGRLATAQAEQPLNKDWISTWNKKAQELIKRLIEQPQPQPPTSQPPLEPPVIPPTPARLVLLKVRVDPNDPDAISGFLAQARKALSEQGAKTINVVLSREEDSE